SRFGGGQMRARLGGRPVLQHVLDELAGAGLTDIIVVLGDDAPELESAIEWRSERRIRNPDPGRGLSSSVRIGLSAVAPGAEAALVVLGDQPLLDPHVLQALLDSPSDPARPIVVPVYAHDRGRNPVLLRPGAWALGAALDGDQGFGPLIRAHPELVVEVPVAGRNPDVDTPGDLAALGWGLRVRANREQAERVREAPEAADFYGPVTSLFRADPRRTDDPVLAALVAHARPAEIWLDVGAGAGRYALGVALHVDRVVAVDPSPGMLAVLRELAAEFGIRNVEPIEARWPSQATSELRAEVVLIAHVGYDIEAIGPFLDALERASGRLCLAVLNDVSPASGASAFWPATWGEERAELPGLSDFVELLRARGRAPEVTPVERRPRDYASRADLLRWVRQQLFVEAGSERDRRLVDELEAVTVETRAGVRLASQVAGIVGIVSWQPSEEPSREP
ncbi:MAG: NTP transferase domain-containing protein, partial [Candidatus Limnocylindrales bacterium]